MSAAPGPHHALTEPEAMAIMACFDRPTLLAMLAEAVSLARRAEGDPARAIAARNALLLAAAALHDLLWGPLTPPGQGGSA